MNCRFCKSKLTTVFLDLGHSPVSNDFLSHTELQNPEVYYPLKTFVCDNCKLVQTQDFKSSNDLFREDYPYYSSVSTTWLSHCEQYVEMMMKRFAMTQSNYVVEVASNDGYLLQYFKEKGVKVCGIEPTKGTAIIAQNKGIPTIIDFFSYQFATDNFSKEKADLIIGNNVLAHVPDINDFIQGLNFTLAPTGIMTFEFPHLLKLRQLNQFDTIYHEHYSYYSLTTLKTIMQHHELEVFDVEELKTHGGSLRIFVQHNKSIHPISSNVSQLISKEIGESIDKAIFYQSFGISVSAIKLNFQSTLIKIKNQKKTIVAYGAAAKGNTFLNYCGVKNDQIMFCADANPHKQGKYLPGSHIPIVSPSEIDKSKPDYVLILPWNLKSEISNQLNHIKTWGGKFIVAIPELQVF